jgi:tetratricopeptide (TPR) repeat protein
MSAAQIIAIALVLFPALGVVVWPLLRSRRADGQAETDASSDKRLELLEDKSSAYRALKELAFDYEAGHLSDDDYASLRARYEARAAEVLAALDALGPAPSPTPHVPEPPTARRSFARHPAALVGGAAVLMTFGIVIGLGVSRYTVPEPAASNPAAAPGSAVDAGVGPPRMALEPGKPIPPEILAGMLNAARQSLLAGRYSEAIAAYQAVLKRDPKNVDAMTHLGLIVAIGGHADAALETFDKAVQIDPGYAPIYLYRGQVLYEVKRDYRGAVQSWQRFLTLVPKGEEHDRVADLVKEAQGKQRAN